jgi:hypothetical protein
MSVKSELHIIAPGICGPLADTSPLASSPVIDRWVKTLSKARSLPSSYNTNELVTSLFDSEFKKGFPSAAFTLLANGLYDPSRFYMHADPVHLQADIDSALLTPGVALNISDVESSVFCQTLNQYFNQDGLTFLVLNNNAWFVSSSDEIKLSTTSLLDATGRNINYLLPSGEDAVRWQQILTEAQMLLHAHEQNVARENAGQASINSLWFHGSAELTITENSSVGSLCSDRDTLKGFAGHIKCDYLNVPDSVNVYTDYLLSCEAGTRNVLHLADLEYLTNYTDVTPWLDQLEDVLDNWIYPLLTFASKNNIKVTLYPCAGKQYHFSKSDALKFWRKDSLEKHVKRY